MSFLMLLTTKQSPLINTRLMLSAQLIEQDRKNQTDNDFIVNLFNKRSFATGAKYTFD